MRRGYPQGSINCHRHSCDPHSARGTTHTHTHTSYTNSATKRKGSKANLNNLKPAEENPREAGASSCAVRCLQRPIASGSRAMRSRLAVTSRSRSYLKAVFATLLAANCVLACIISCCPSIHIKLRPVIAVELGSAGSAKSVQWVTRHPRHL